MKYWQTLTLSAVTRKVYWSKYHFWMGLTQTTGGLSHVTRSFSTSFSRSSACAQFCVLNRIQQREVCCFAFRQNVCTGWKKKKSHKSQLLVLPPCTGSDDFRLLCDASSKHIAHTASLYYTHSAHRLTRQFSNICIIMSSQSEPTSTGDKLLQTPGQVWTTTIYWHIWGRLNIVSFWLAANYKPSCL